jgi:hypothetical protein
MLKKLQIDLRVRSVADMKRRIQSSMDLTIGSSIEETITFGMHTLPQKRLCRSPETIGGICT